MPHLNCKPRKTKSHLVKRLVECVLVVIITVFTTPCWAGGHVAGHSASLEHVGHK